jgi:hypothetical protein
MERDRRHRARAGREGPGSSVEGSASWDRGWRPSMPKGRHADHRREWFFVPLTNRGSAPPVGPADSECARPCRAPAGASSKSHPDPVVRDLPEPIAPPTRPSRLAAQPRVPRVGRAARVVRRGSGHGIAPAGAAGAVDDLDLSLDSLLHIEIPRVIAASGCEQSAAHLPRRSPRSVRRTSGAMGTGPWPRRFRASAASTV